MRHSRPAASAAFAAVIIAAAAVGRIAAGGPGAAPPAATAAPDLPAEKQAIADALRQRQATAPRGDKAHDPGRPAPAPVAEQAPVGMLGALNAPVSGSLFTPTSAWAGWAGTTTYYLVWAGYATDSPGTGLVFVERRSGSAGSLDDTLPSATALVTPAGVSGAVRIVGASGTVLTLADASGAMASFNPATAPVQ
jgi:aminopeptidase S